jgi:DNA-binding transcriptional MerR regulator
MKKYSAKGLSRLAGVSVRTLHHYDKIGLLKPAIRTEARYRLYGEDELFKLQQILFYKELELSLNEIIDLLNNPDFDILKALEGHKQTLLSKQKRISAMLNTIEKTVSSLKGKTMITDEELYEGFTAGTVNEIRDEAIKKYGRHNIETSETYLKKLSKQQLELLKEEQKDILGNLYNLSAMNPESEVVQLEIARHYKNVRRFWGTDGSSDPQSEAYKGLGELYLTDERFTFIEGKAQPAFAKFLSKAMACFADTQLE